MSEKIYTLDEAAIELARLECARDGHRPHNALMTFGRSTPRKYLCECGEVSWTPSDDKKRP